MTDNEEVPGGVSQESFMEQEPNWGSYHNFQGHNLNTSLTA